MRKESARLGTGDTERTGRAGQEASGMRYTQAAGPTARQGQRKQGGQAVMKWS